MTMQISAGRNLWIWAARTSRAACDRFCTWRRWDLQVSSATLRRGDFFLKTAASELATVESKWGPSDFAWNMCWVHVGHTQKLMGIGGSRNGGIPKWVSFVGLTRWRRLHGASAKSAGRWQEEHVLTGSILSTWAVLGTAIQAEKSSRHQIIVCNKDRNTLSIHRHSLAWLHISFTVDSMQAELQAESAEDSPGPS